MKFEEVLPALQAGRNIRRQSWVSDYWVDRHSGFTLIDVHLEADDWEIVKEKVKKTVWVNVYQTGRGEIFMGDGHWNSQSKAIEHVSYYEYTYLGAHSITVEVDE
jgi:hypothetical protein